MHPLKTPSVIGLALVGLLSLSFQGFGQDRQLKLAGAINFRDLGGYTASGGKHLKWKKLYRSAALNELTAADLDTLASRHVYSVVDFRGIEESAQAPDKLLPGTVYLLLPAGSDSQAMMAHFSKIQNGDSVMRVFYANTQPLIPRYQPFFQRLVSLPDTSALVFHCTAGKDRTGIGSALLLYALGVPEDQIMQDYLASNVYRAEDNKKRAAQMQAAGMDIQAANDVLAVKEGYLAATFDALKKEYGSLDQFLEKGLGLSRKDLAILRSKFTE